jgi:HEAT repeat protein
MTPSQRTRQQPSRRVGRRCGQRYRRTMERGLATLLATAWLVGFAAGTDQHEPTYQGRTLSDWTRDLDPHTAVMVGHEPPAWIAIGHMGTNAIPTLLTWMSEPDPPEPLKSHLAPCFTPSRSQRAEFAFRILGGAARPAIPKLTHLARKSSDPKRAERCTDSLASIGPEAIPSLLSLATNGPRMTRWYAIAALEYFGNDRRVTIPAVPVLIKCMGDRKDDVAGKAAGVLSRCCSPDIVLPALTNALRSPSARRRKWAVRCLGWEEQAVSAIPLLRAAMRDPNYVVRDSATNVLRGWGGWELREEGWVRVRDTSALNGISPDFFSNTRRSTPQGRANGSQPVGSETNRAPAAGASRRPP